MKKTTYFFLFIGLISSMFTCKPVPIEAPIAKFELSNDACIAPCDPGLLNKSQHATTYEWSFGDGGRSSQENPLHEYTIPGIYTVQLIAINNEGMADSITHPITINETGTVIANFTASQNTCTTPCGISFTNTSSHADNYSWDFDDGNSSTQANPNHEYQENGIYTVTLIATNLQGDSDTSNAEIIVTTSTFELIISGSEHEYGRGIVETSDGGYIMIGSTGNLGMGGQDLYMVKISQGGTIEWEQTFGGSQNDFARSIAKTADGNYIITGYTSSFGAGNADIYLLKVTEAGDLIWSQTFGGTNRERSYYVAQTSDGGYLIGAETRSFGAGNTDIYVVKADANGNHEWQQTFGGALHDYGRVVGETADGYYFIAGYVESFGAGGQDVFLAKMEHDGTPIWEHTYGGSGTDHCRDVEVTMDGGFALMAYTSSFGNGNQVYLIKADANGYVEWERNYGGSASEIGFAVEQLTDGSYILTGCTRSYGAGSKDIYLIKTNINGLTEWERTYGDEGYDLSTSIVITSDGGYIMAGETSDTDPPQNYDAILLKTDAEGNVQ